MTNSCTIVFSVFMPIAAFLFCRLLLTTRCGSFTGDEHKRCVQLIGCSCSMTASSHFVYQSAVSTDTNVSALYKSCINYWVTTSLNRTNMYTNISVYITTVCFLHSNCQMSAEIELYYKQIMYCSWSCRWHLWTYGFERSAMFTGCYWSNDCTIITTMWYSMCTVEPHSCKRYSYLFSNSCQLCILQH